MNKKALIGVIIAVAILVIGTITYYFYNQASADAYTQTFCAGFQGTQWRNCNSNVATWRKFMATHTEKKFLKMVKY